MANKSTGAGLTALALCAGVSLPAMAQNYPAGLYVGIHADQSFSPKGVMTQSNDVAWLAAQGNACASSTQTGCVFTQRSSAGNQAPFVISGIFVNLSWTALSPCIGVAGGSCTRTLIPTSGEQWNEVIALDESATHTISTFNSAGAVSGSFQTGVGYTTAPNIDPVLRAISQIETARGTPLKLSISLNGGDYVPDCGTTLVGSLSPVDCTATPGTLQPPSASGQLNTPYWAMSLVANNLDGSISSQNGIAHGFIYTVHTNGQDASGNTKYECSVSPSPWGSVYYQLYEDAVADYYGYITNGPVFGSSLYKNQFPHSVDVIKLGGMNSRTAELSISGYGEQGLTYCNTQNSGKTAWLAEGYSTKRAEKAFQNFVYQLTSIVGTNTAISIASISSQNFPAIQGTTPLSGASAVNWPEQFEGGMIFDLFGGTTSLNGSYISPTTTNLLADASDPPFIASVSSTSSVTNGKSISLFGIQTDGLINATACESSTQTLCSGGDTGTSGIFVAPTSNNNAQKYATDYENQINCQVANINTSSSTVPNLITSTALFSLQAGVLGTADLGPQGVGQDSQPSRMAIGFQDEPLMVAALPGPATGYLPNDATAVVATTALAATYGADYAEIWANGIAAAMQNNSLSLLGTTTALLTAGNPLGCAAGASN